MGPLSIIIVYYLHFLFQLVSCFLTYLAPESGSYLSSHIALLFLCPSKTCIDLGLYMLHVTTTIKLAQARRYMRIQKCVKFIDNLRLSTQQTDGSSNLSDRHCLLISDLMITV